MELNLKGKVAVVTGGGGVLGGSISRSLVENGVKVAILDIRQEQLDNRVKELKPLGEVMGISAMYWICKALRRRGKNCLPDGGVSTFW